MEEDPKSRKSGITIYEYDAQLALAFQTDCETLFNKFKQEKQCNFSTFARIWKESDFISIFEDQTYILTLHALIENFFFITRKFLFASDRYVQVGAIYVLYALYYKQPVDKWVKIRLTQADVDKLNEIVESHKKLDLLFVYNKMKLDCAFRYCALPQPLGLEQRFLKRQNLSAQNIKDNDTDTPLCKFKEFMESDPCLVELEETNDEYQKLAAKFKKKCDKLYIFSSRVGADMQQAYSNVFNANLNAEDDQNRLKVIKSRAMTNTNAIYRAERTVVTAATLDAPSTSSTT